jgi:voltage-gated potassium channel
LRQTVWRQVDPEGYELDGLSQTNRAVVSIVALSSIFAILETEPTFDEIAPQAFARLEGLFAVLFLVEYVAKIRNFEEYGAVSVMHSHPQQSSI